MISASGWTSSLIIISARVQCVRGSGPRECKSRVAPTARVAGRGRGVERARGGRAQARGREGARSSTRGSRVRVKGRACAERSITKGRGGEVLETVRTDAQVEVED